MFLRTLRLLCDPCGKNLTAKIAKDATEKTPFYDVAKYTLFKDPAYAGMTEMEINVYFWRFPK